MLELLEQTGFMYYHILCRMLDLDDEGIVRNSKCSEQSTQRDLIRNNTSHHRNASV